MTNGSNMPDDRHDLPFIVTRTDLVRSPLQTSDTADEKDGSHPLRLKFTDWTEDYTDPQPMQPFALREFAPDAADFLAEAGHFSQRDIRFLVDRMRLDVDPKDTTAFYGAFLDVVEKQPCIFPMLEAEVVHHRNGAKGAKSSAKSSREKFARTLSKLPLSKLRLDGSEALQARLGEFVKERDVATALWVAAFCEYAIDHYYQFVEANSKERIDMTYRLAIGEKNLKDLFEDFYDSAETSGDWSMVAKTLELQIESCRGLGTPVSQDIYSDLVMTISALAGNLNERRSSEDFRLLAGLSEIAATIAEEQAQASVSEIIGTLNGLGVEIDAEELNDEQAGLFQLDKIQFLMSELEESRAALPGFQARSAEVDAKIAEATKARRYDALRSLAYEAETIDRQLRVEEALRESLTEITRLILANDTQRLSERLADVAAPQTHTVGDDSVDLEKTVDDEVQAATATLANPDQGEEPPPGETHAAEEVEPVLGADEVAHKEAEDATTKGVGEASADSIAAEMTAHQYDHARPADEDGAYAKNEEAIGEHLSEEPEEAVMPTEPLPDAGNEAEVDANFETREVATDPYRSAEGSTVVIETVASDAPPPLDVRLLPELISRGLIGIAADAAESLEAHRHSWPVEAAALRSAVASRAQLGDFGHDMQRFLTVANRAANIVESDLGANVLFGALLRPAILQQSFSLRSMLPELARGSLGPHLQEAAAAIAKLDYDFPPGPDILAELSGAQFVPKKKRIADRLAEWSEITSQKTSRWKFATSFMHHVISESGLIGKARVAIEAGRRDAVALAKNAIEKLGDSTEIENRAVEFATATGRPMARLHPKGIEYLQRHFDEALGLLSAWIAAVERDGTQTQRSETRLRSIVGNLHSRLTKARSGLRALADGTSLESVIAGWLVEQVDEAIEALRGSDTGQHATVEEALTADRDLLPNVARRAAADPEALLGALVEVFATTGIPEPREAYDQAREQGAFEVASRLAIRYAFEATDELGADMDAFTAIWREEIINRERRMKKLAKVDYSHQEEIARRLSWCKSALNRLDTVADRSGIDNLDDIPLYTAEFDRDSAGIEANIRRDQDNRIRKYCTELNADDADALLAVRDELTLEAVEDRIAQLRDGRSTATFEAQLEGLVAEFNPDFVYAACGSDWPSTMDAYKRALEEAGPLATDEGRRGAAVEFLGLYHELCATISNGKPAVPTLRAFFEEVGFENVKVSGISRLGRTKSWNMTMMGDLRSDGWFLPPVFGSKATSGYALLLVGPDTLPETIQKALDPEIPTILLLSGVADLAKRREFAERLRATAIPALLIDEALVAFAATRRDTRARTVFECGLPYGRVEPYTTDAGQVPTEMFFGREAEIRDIMSKTADGCLVYGGRQLGKSALLSHVARTRHAPEDNRIVVRREVKALGNSEQTSEIWRHLNAMLVRDGVVKESSRTADAVSRDIREWLVTRANSQVVCLFDETDHFMAADTKDDYPQLSHLKELMEDTERAFKVVFAGLHNVKRMHRQPNSPLAHLGRAICIGPLNRTEDDKRAAHDLVIAPMRVAGFKFESMEAVEEILAWANYYPSLVQEYARGLLGTLHGAGSGMTYRLPEDGPLWTIPTADLFAHRGFQQIELRTREKFHLTLELDPRYALVAYTLGWLNAQGYEHQVLVSGFRASELLEHASIFWPKTAERPSQAAFDALLDELFDLGVLGRVPIPETQRFTYCLRTRQVAAMLGSREDIEHGLLELEEKDPTVAYDRTIHRRRYAPPGKPISVAQKDLPYSPLTDFQIEQLLDGDGAPARIVCGLDELGLSKVGIALKRIAEIGHLPGVGEVGVDVVITDGRKDIRPVLDRVRKSETRRKILVHTPASAVEATQELAWLEGQVAVLNGHVRPILLLDAADAEMRELAIRRHNQSEFLAAWGAEMVRVHLSNIECPELDTPEMRKKILTATGGIPNYTVKLINALVQAQDQVEVVKTWEPALWTSDAIVEGTLGQVLIMVENIDDAGDYDALDDMIRETIGGDLITHGPDLVATGLVTTFNAKTKRVRRSAFGDLLAKQIES